MDCEELCYLNKAIKENNNFIIPGEKAKMFWYGDFNLLTEILKIIESDIILEEKKKFIEYYLQVREFCKDGVNKIWEEE